jgi:hypothetical protein
MSKTDEKGTTFALRSATKEITRQMLDGLIEILVNEYNIDPEEIEIEYVSEEKWKQVTGEE